MISESAVRSVFERSLKLKEQESCLILTDKIQEEIAKHFYNFAKKICKECHIEVMEPLEEHGQEPLQYITDLMQKYDVQLLITNKSLSHTKARRDATEKGARIASMPTITESIINRCLDIDYDEVQDFSLKLYNLLNNSTTLKITTELGTSITIERGDRKIDYSGGLFSKKSDFGNLPEGEVSFGPVNANGIFIVDASFPDFGILKEPLTFKVKQGAITDIGGEFSEELKLKLDKIGTNAYKIAEIGIGTNPKARINGEVLEDEKVLGTCHIALGNNLFYGGTNDVPIHLDGVITKPTIYADNKLIMDKGEPKF